MAGAGPGWSPTPRGHTAGGWISSIDPLLLTASSCPRPLHHVTRAPYIKSLHQVTRAPYIKSPHQVTRLAGSRGVADTTSSCPRPCTNHSPRAGAPLQQPSPRAPATTVTPRPCTSLSLAPSAPTFWKLSPPARPPHRAHPSSALAGYSSARSRPLPWPSNAIDQGPRSRQWRGRAGAYTVWAEPAWSARGNRAGQLVQY